MNKRQIQVMLDKIGDDEELFLLRAQDTLAVPTIEYWCDLAAKLAVPPKKILEAYICRDRMRHHSPRRLPD